MSKQLLVAILKPLHGLFNLLVLALLLYHASQGIRIRSARRSGGPVPFRAVKRHRVIGPVVASLAAAGYLAGIFLVLYDKGSLLEHPLHLTIGSLVVLLLLATCLLSRSIEGEALKKRSLHFAFGIAVLTFYGLEVLIGLSILF